MKRLDLRNACAAGLLCSLFTAPATPLLAIEQAVEKKPDFAYQTERFADLRILRYKVPNFEELSLQQKKLAYYLYKASLSGRDIMYDQNYKHNLTIRRTLEEIVKHYEGNRETHTFQKLMVYTKRVWFSNGIHHHYSNAKILPDISLDNFKNIISQCPNANFPRLQGETMDDFIERLQPLMFDPSIDGLKVNRAKHADKVATSAVNFYEGVTEAEVKEFYNEMRDPNDPTPISYGLNSKLARVNGLIQERVWKVGGMYGSAIEKITYWLEKAIEVAENEKQKTALELLVKYYKTGSLKDFDEYSIAWVKDSDSTLDLINGFIEVYNDPLGMRGSFESVLEMVDPAGTRRIEAFSKEAQWFEETSPTMPEHKKEEVKGIVARSINVIVGAGDASPSSPIGINLPNSNWIRANHGSKSVSLANIVASYNKASGSSLNEFAWDQAEVEREKKYGETAKTLHTDLHEVIGHASGRIEIGVGQPSQTLKEHASTLEEARADIFALYFIMDPKLIEMGLMDTLEVGKTAYDRYIRNGLMLQLQRIKLGNNIRQAHMQNRQLLSKLAYEKGKSNNVIEKKIRDGKTFFVINDYDKLRAIFGEILVEIQRIKSQGDYAAGQALVETYGIKVDKDLHKEVLDRFANLDVAPYSGFINPELIAEMNGAGYITDVKVNYPTDFTQQMMSYSAQYSFLPNYN